LTKLLLATKTYELRLADWNCESGDVLELIEINPKTKNPTGRTMRRKVGYVGKTKGLDFWTDKEIDKFGYQIISLLPDDKAGVSQKAVIFNKTGKFLVLLRGSTAPSNPLKWDLPGGDVDFGEDPQESILREIEEEAGLKVNDLEILDVEAHINSRGEHWFTVAYRAVAVNDDVKISWEHNEYRWVDSREFAELSSIPKIVRFVQKAID
jgi:8-oxo-dGTP diphosphatase